MPDVSQSVTGSTNDNVKQTATYRGLKAVVIILGVLIVVGLGVLIAGFAMRLGGHGPARESGGFAHVTLAPGAKLVSMDVSGNRLVLHVSTEAGDEIDIVDTETGRLVGQVKSAPTQK